MFYAIVLIGFHNVDISLKYFGIIPCLLAPSLPLYP